LGSRPKDRHNLGTDGKNGHFGVDFRVKLGVKESVSWLTNAKKEGAMGRFRSLVLFLGCWIALLPANAGAISLTLHDLSTSPRTVQAYLGTQANNSDRFTTGVELAVALGEGSDAYETIAYCVELNESISLYGRYDVALAEPWTQPGGLAAAWLMDTYAPGRGNAIAGYEARDVAAALQLAIWRVVHGAALTVSRSNSSEILSLYDFFMDSIPSAFPRDVLAMNYDLAQSDGVQDLLVYNPTPEPGTLLLLAVGLAGGYFLKRRR
jgi:hypothetical protein